VTAVSVDDLDAACQRFEDLGVNWKKRLTDGRMKNVAFVLDPDNYCKLSASCISPAGFLPRLSSLPGPGSF
jgi:hypothetical protein